MCGIAGIIGKRNDYVVDGRLLTRMTELLEHRGPDDHGVELYDWWGFGHRRLSIIDLEKGHQPFIIHERNLAITFNGEIYNFKEIRNQLSANGHRFRTATDTEVIVHAFDEWGIEAIERFNGMFAFAIADMKDNSFWIVRDRLGIKPLYYTELRDAWVFASEPKSLLIASETAPDINPAAIHSYLSYRYPLNDLSYYCGVKKLLPGCYLRIRNGGASIHRYWNIPKEGITESYSEEQYLRELADTMVSSVKYRLISDVPVGAYLSGGLDSSLVSSIMSRETGPGLKTYTIGFPDDQFNEFDYAQEVADHISASHKEILMSVNDYFDLNEQLIVYRDGPLAVPNEVPLFLMSQILKNDITVVLSGEGADEIFGGYGRIFHSPSIYKNQIHTESPASPDHIDAGMIEYIIAEYAYISKEQRKMYLSDTYGPADDTLPENILRESFYCASNHDDYTRLQWVFEKHHLPGLLERLDNSTMAASVEGRVPFVDHRLVEFSFRLPKHFKNRWNAPENKSLAKQMPVAEYSEVLDTTKYLLRQMAIEYVPKSVIERRKIGFPVPLAQWFRGSGQEFIKNVVMDDSFSSHGLFNVKYIRNRIDDPRYWDDPQHGIHMWMIANIALWLNSLTKSQ